MDAAAARELQEETSVDPSSVVLSQVRQQAWLHSCMCQHLPQHVHMHEAMLCAAWDRACAWAGQCSSIAVNAAVSMARWATG